MPDYEVWNRALLAHFVDSTVPGAPVFLAVDDDVLTRIAGHSFPESNQFRSTDDAVLDFEEAVRARVSPAGERVNLRAIEGTGANEEPRCVAFLGALVLAASRMRDTEDTDGVDYFTHLRRILRLSERGGRPAGMESGGEEPFWSIWNLWLQVGGRLSTATPGPDGPQRYIHYARSQALLRHVDKDRLRDLFQDRGWRADVDAETLLLRVRREAPYLTVQLRELLASGSQRLTALADAIQDVHEDWRFDPSGMLGRSSRRRLTLYAGLYRQEDLLTATVNYYIYPLAPRGVAASLEVQIDNELWALRPERPGCYYPLGPVNSHTLFTGARYPVQQPAEPEELVLPARDYWILVPDEDAPDSGAYATWNRPQGRPQLGLPFVLICRENVLPEFDSLVKERLIEYAGEPVEVLGGGWYELRNCVIASEAWSGAHLTNAELHDALRPADQCSVIVSGGLRLPDRPAWLDGCGPSVAVSGYGSEAELIVTDVGTEQVITERTQGTGEALPVVWPGPGTFLVVGRVAGQEARRLVTIGSWDDLRLSAPEKRECVTIGTHRLCGAALDSGAS